MKYITQLIDLQKYIGKYLAFVIENYEDKEIVFIKKLTSVTNSYEETRQDKKDRISDVDGLNTYGMLTAEVYPQQGIYGPLEKLDKPYRTNAQNKIRIPTKQEMNTYRNIWRKYRIFGHI